MGRKRLWRVWAKALGAKESSCHREADMVALMRTFIFASYLATNAFIIAGVIRHWNDNIPLAGVEPAPLGLLRSAPTTSWATRA